MHAFSKSAYFRVQGRVPGRRRLRAVSLLELLLGLSLLGLIAGLGVFWVFASARAFEGAQQHSTAYRELDWVLAQLKRDAQEAVRVDVFEDQAPPDAGAVRPLLRFEGLPTPEYPYGVWVHYCLAYGDPGRVLGLGAPLEVLGLYRQLTPKGLAIDPLLLSDRTVLSLGLTACRFEEAPVLEGGTPGLVRVSLTWAGAEAQSFFFLANQLEEVKGASFEELIP